MKDQRHILMHVLCAILKNQYKKIKFTTTNYMSLCCKQDTIYNEVTEINEENNRYRDRSDIIK